MVSDEVGAGFPGDGVGVRRKAVGRRRAVEALEPDLEEVLRVDRLYVQSHFLDPRLQLVAGRIGFAARFVHQFPGEDRRVVSVGGACEGVDSVEDGLIVPINRL